MLAINNGRIVSPKSKRLDPEYTKLTVDVKRDVVAKTRAICALTDESISDVVNDLLEKWIELKKKDGSFEI